MKKIIITVSIILMVSFFATSAFTSRGSGKYGNSNSRAYNNSAHQSFYNDTQALRSSIAADRAELNAMMAGTNPDPKRARILSEQISLSENELRTKAQQNNIPGMGMMGYGRGWNMDMHGYNNHYMNCW